MPAQIEIESRVEVRKSATLIHKMRENQVVRQGELKKRNEYLMRQTRLFVLSKDGQIKYYKNQTLQRGTIFLCPETRLNKTGRSSFEIVTPSRTWYLYSSDD